MTELHRRLRRWVLLNGNRSVVALVFLIATFLVLVVLGAIEVIDTENVDAVRGVAGGFVPGLIAFLSIVLAINQLVLTQEFSSAGEARKRIERIRDYRREVEAVAGAEPSPVLPTDFLAFVVRAIAVEAMEVKESLDSDTESDVREALETFATDVADEANRAHESLEAVQPGRIHALLPVLEYDDSGQLLQARRLRSDAGKLSEETDRSLSALIEAIELFNAARTQFRTAYTQRVLARLSRQLLYVGVPALVAVVVLGLLHSENLLSVSAESRLLLVSGTLTVAFTPLALLSSYLLRVSTVSERTIGVGPFVSRPKTVQTQEPLEDQDQPTTGTFSSENGERGDGLGRE